MINAKVATISNHNLFEPQFSDGQTYVLMHHRDGSNVTGYIFAGQRNHKSPPRNHKWVKQAIYSDDTIKVVKEKLATYVFPGLHPSKIYMWYNEGKTSRVLGIVFKAIDGLKYDGACNPFDPSFSTSGNSIVDYNTDEYRVLSEFQTNGIIHFSTYADVEHHIARGNASASMLRYCFPTLVRTEQAELAKLVENRKKNDGIMQKFSLDSSKSSAHRFEIGKGIISLSFGDVAAWPLGFEIYQLFELLSTSAKWPFMRLVVSANKRLGMRNMYKLYTPALRYDDKHYVSDVQLKRWTIGNTQARQSFIEVMVPYTNAVFALLRIYMVHTPKQVVVEARLNAHKNGFLEFSSDILHPDKSNEFSICLDEFIGTISEILGEPAMVHGHLSPSKLRTTMHIHSESIMANLESMGAYAAELKPIVSVIPKDGDGITLMYKRVPNLKTMANISYVLAAYAKSKASTESKADILGTVFDLSEGEVDQLIQDLKRFNSFYASQRTNKWMPPEINLSNNSAGQVVATINGVNDLRTHMAIINLILYLIYVSDSPSTSDSPQQTNSHVDDEMTLSDLDALFDLSFADNANNASNVNNASSPFKMELSKDVSNKSFQKYALKSLQRADPNVFDASYSRTCQKSANRQPIIVSKIELDRINRDFPGSYFDNYISNFGSDESKRKRNIYICPEIWCPLSRVSMTSTQLADMGGKCPNPNEPVMHIQNQYFDKRDGSNAPGTKPRFASFTKKNGKCYPCCFAPSSIETARIKHKKSLQECASDVNGNQEDLQPKNEGDRYIKGQQYPLETNRYGVLPPAMVASLPKMNYPLGPGGTGNIARGVDCLVRGGVNDGDIIKSIELIWSHGGLIRALVDNMSIEIFMVLNRGKLIRMFIKDGNLSPFARRKFHDWTTMTPEGKSFSKSFVGSNESNYETEFIIWSAMENFKRFLLDNEVKKTEDTVLDACNRSVLFRAFGGTQICVIVCEVDTTGQFNIICDAYGDIANSELQQYAIIIKQGSNYEPVCRVHNASKRGLTVTYHFKKGDYTPTDKIIDMYLEHGRTKMDPLCCTQNVLFQVLDYNFHVVGVITKDKTYKTISCCEPVVGREGRPRFLFIDQVAKFAKRGFTDDFIQQSRDEHNIFSRITLADPRIEYHRVKQGDEELLARLRDALMQHFGTKMAKYMQEIKGSGIPFFKEKDLVRTKLVEYVDSNKTKIMPGLDKSKLDEMIEKLVMEFVLNDRLPQITHNIRKKMLKKARQGKAHDAGGDEVVFDQLAVDSGKLWERFASLANPYVCCPNPASSSTSSTSSTRSASVATMK